MGLSGAEGADYFDFARGCFEATCDFEEGGFFEAGFDLEEDFAGGFFEAGFEVEAGLDFEDDCAGGFFTAGFFEAGFFEAEVAFSRAGFETGFTADFDLPAVPATFVPFVAGVGVDLLPFLAATGFATFVIAAIFAGFVSSLAESTRSP